MDWVFQRNVVDIVMDSLQKREQFIQIIVGPRQVGKTTAARQIAEQWRGAKHYAAADMPLPPGPEWVEAQWFHAKRLQTTGGHKTLLILDEVQKVRGWHEALKALWDSQTYEETADLVVLLLGSSALLLAKGMSESLAGRFLLHRCLHWTYSECRTSFGWSLEQWVFFGGYPGAAALANDEATWRSYIVDSLIETVLVRDVLALQTVAKPTLLRHLFTLSAQFPAHLLSYNKMLGQLQDAGNTTTLAHYLRLLETAFLVSGLERYSAGKARTKGTSPKLILWNNALVSALNLRSLEQALHDSSWWGWLVENAVGAHFLNHLQSLTYRVFYWRERGKEVDFVICAADKVYAIEVKSGRPHRTQGLESFMKRYPSATPLLIGTGGLSFEEFFSMNPIELFQTIN